MTGKEGEVVAAVCCALSRPWPGGRIAGRGSGSGKGSNPNVAGVFQSAAAQQQLPNPSLPLVLPLGALD